MRSPDEIKRMLITCTELNMPQDVQHRTMCDALALIQQLQADNAKKDETIQMLQGGNAHLMRMIDEECEKTVNLEAERDAYREGLKTEVGCYVCKHYVDDPDYDSNECMSCGKNMCNFELRGVQKEDSDA